MVFPKLTRQRYDELPPQARPLVRVPRYAHLLSLPHVYEIVEGERSLARYYWEAYHYVEESNRLSELTGLLDSGMRAAPAMYLGLDNRDRRPDIEITASLRRKQVTMASKILSAMAFEMFFPSPNPIQHNDEFSDVKIREEKVTDANLAGSLFHIVGTKRVDEFYEKVFARLDHSKIYRLPSSFPRTIVDWEHDLMSLLNMNARGLEYFVIDGNQSKLQFADRTVQEFFAAVWLTNYATKEDINRMWERLPDSWGGDEHKDFSEVWRFAAEMPRENCDDRHWIWLFSPFYDCSLSEHFRATDGSPIRSTELIYLTWDRMKDTESGKVFRDEFPSIMRGEQGKEKQRIAQQMLEGFRWDKPLCEGKHGANDNGTLEMGWEEVCPDLTGIRSYLIRDRPCHFVKLTSFYMNMFCVRNLEFELFEARRVFRREFSEEVPASELADHPVVRVSWYDAACFAKWLGEIKFENGHWLCFELPTEAQWEYACRAGFSGAYSWDGKLDDALIMSGYCNFDGRYPWYESCRYKGNNWHVNPVRLQKYFGSDEVEEGTFLGKTIPVDGRTPNGTVVGKNRWGYFQFHGNVWEWCCDWYSSETYFNRIALVVLDPIGPTHGTHRVMRGGGWYSDGEHCLAARRKSCDPKLSDSEFGFRLVAFPTSQTN